MKRSRTLMNWVSRYIAASAIMILSAWHTAAQTSDPAIVSQPQDVSAGAATTVQFVISLSGTMPITNSWFRITNSNAVKISGSVGSNSSGTVSFTNTQVAQTPQSYFAICSNRYGVVTSRVATLTIAPMPPTITSEPQDVQTNAGANVTLKVTATGTSPLSYQWSYNGSTLAAATKSSLSLSNASPSASGSYQAIVSNVYGFATSRVATVTIVASPPTITGEPQDIQTNSGANVTLRVTATGTLPLSYQWYFNGSALAAATKSSLSVGNASVNDSGSYQAIVTNNYGSATSRVATVTIVASPPTITGEPPDIQVNSGTNVTLKVTATGYLPLSYQWYYNGSALAAGNVSSLFWTNVSTNISGSYQAIITNYYGSATSRVATLTVVGVPPTIGGQPADIQTTAGASVTFRVTASGYAPLSYQWHYNGSALAAATRSSLSLTNVSANDSGSYQAIVSNYYGSATSRLATLTITNATPQPPAITKQPTNVIVSSNGPSSATFSVTATGATPLIYQWYFNGGVVDAATASSLTLSNAAGDTSHAGSYKVFITNYLGSVTSSVATLTFRSSSSPRITLLSHSVTNGDVLLLSSLETNKNYTLQSSSNLVYWANVYSFLAHLTQLRYTNYEATNLTRFYYRISSP